MDRNMSEASPGERTTWPERSWNARSLIGWTDIGCASWRRQGSFLPDRYGDNAPSPPALGSFLLSSVAALKFFTEFARSSALRDQVYCLWNDVDPSLEAR
jgi:hypothetical protein